LPLGGIVVVELLEELDVLEELVRVVVLDVVVGRRLPPSLVVAGPPFASLWSTPAGSAYAGTGPAGVGLPELVGTLAVSRTGP